MTQLAKEKISQRMASIKSENTKVELKVFRELRKQKIHFQSHYKKAPGTPDIALPSRKKAVFINGDFWHGYRLKQWRHKLTTPYWINKIEGNIKRDKRNYRKLKAEGWYVMKVWEHQLKSDFDKWISEITSFLKS